MVNLQSLQEKCLFCEPEAHGQAAQILLRSDNFYLFAGIGPIVEGYIIIAPHRCDWPHLPLHSFSDVPPDLLDEVLFLRGLISEFYRDVYSEEASMHFEHGQVGVCYPRSGNTKHCYHAHLCCYPRSFPLWKNFGPEFGITEIEGLPELSRTVDGQPYLLVQSSTIDYNAPPASVRRETWVSQVAIIEPTAHVPSQYLRKLLSQQVGDEWSWDWALFPQLDLVEKVIAAFQDWLPRTSKYVLTQDNDEPYRLDYLKSVEKSNQFGNNSVAQEFHETWVGRVQYGAIGRFLSVLPARKEEQQEERPRILDIGCGPGHYLRAFHAAGLACIGIDPSDEMVSIAKEIISTSAQPSDTNDPTPPPRVEQAGLLETSFAGGSFDGIWYSAAVVHVPRRVLPAQLTCLYQILKEDGVLYISAQVGRGSAIRREGRVFFYYTVDELRTLFDQAGFLVVDQWSDIAKRGTRGGRAKPWIHFLLRKQVQSDLEKREALEKIGVPVPGRISIKMARSGDRIDLQADLSPAQISSLVGTFTDWINSDIGNLLLAPKKWDLAVTLRKYAGGAWGLVAVEKQSWEGEDD